MLGQKPTDLQLIKWLRHLSTGVNTNVKLATANDPQLQIVKERIIFIIYGIPKYFFGKRTLSFVTTK
jgi:hypothetical protein